MNTIVSTNWVYKNINIGNLIIFDCSWYLPQEKRDTYIEFKNCHINNSHFLAFKLFFLNNPNSHICHKN